MRVAFLGARGIPACYSGYDTLVAEVAIRLAAKKRLEVIVYCRPSYYSRRPREINGVRLLYVPTVRGKGLESLLHSFLSALHVLTQKVDLIYFVDPANAPFCLMLRALGKRVVLHTDGLGWRRRKWGRLARRYYKGAEWLAARSATALVADHPVMQQYYRAEYGADSALIAYGATNAAGRDDRVYGEFGLQPGAYCLVVARLERENNTDLIAAEFNRASPCRPLVVVGDSPYDPDYMERLEALGGRRVRFIGRVNDQAKLNSLYAGAYVYLHGHEVGGTNPSLLRAMDAGIAPVVLDTPFNCQVIADAGFTFTREPGNLSSLLRELEARPEDVAEVGRRAGARAAATYTWDAVAEQHDALFRRVVDPGRAIA
jgi:glycosyltransferase involved in cell wall biosynthesis